MIPWTRAVDAGSTRVLISHGFLSHLHRQKAPLMMQVGVDETAVVLRTAPWTSPSVWLVRRPCLLFASSSFFFCACLLSLFAQKYIIPVVALPRGSRRAANTDKTASPRAQCPPVTFNIKSATYTSGRILRFASMVDAK